MNFRDWQPIRCRTYLVHALVFKNASCEKTLAEVEKRTDRIELLCLALGRCGIELEERRGHPSRDPFIHVAKVLSEALAREVAS